MVTVGVEGRMIKSDTVIRTALLAAGATKQAISTALTGAKSEPTWFEPVVTVSWARYQQLRPTIYPVPGTVFQTVRTRGAGRGRPRLPGRLGRPGHGTGTAAARRSLQRAERRRPDRS